MRVLDISFDFDTVKANEKERKDISLAGFVSAFESILIQAIMSVYERGLPLDKGRIYTRIQRAMDALGATGTELRIEEAEYDFIREIFGHPNLCFSPSQYRLVSIYLDRIENARRE